LRPQKRQIRHHVEYLASLAAGKPVLNTIPRRHARDETIAWLLWYNKARLHSTLAYVSPMQFEQNWLMAHGSGQASQLMISVMG